MTALQQNRSVVSPLIAADVGLTHGHFGQVHAKVEQKAIEHNGDIYEVTRKNAARAFRMEMSDEEIGKAVSALRAETGMLTILDDKGYKEATKEQEEMFKAYGYVPHLKYVFVEVLHFATHTCVVSKECSFFVTKTHDKGWKDPPKLFNIHYLIVFKIILKKSGHFSISTGISLVRNQGVHVGFWETNCLQPGQL